MTRYVFAAFFIAALAFPQPASGSNCDGSIVTYGSATVDAKPDVAFVTLHVQGLGLLMEDAYRAASEKAATIANAIREKHTEISLVEQMTLDLKQRESDRWGPDRESDTPQPAAVIRIRVTLPPNPQLAIAVVDTGMRSGGSLVDPVSQRWVGMPAGAVVYGLEDADAHMQAALEQAFADAHERAQRTAAAAGMALGAVTAIGCQGKTCDWSNSSYYTGARDLPTDYVSSDPIRVEVSASVCVTYQLLPK